MSDPIDFDRDLLQPAIAAFAVPVEFRPGDGLPVTLAPDGAVLSGVFEAAGLHIRLDTDGNPVTTARPMLGMRAAAFAADNQPYQGALFRIAGAVYVVADIMPDGVGHLEIALTKLGR